MLWSLLKTVLHIGKAASPTGRAGAGVTTEALLEQGYHHQLAGQRAAAEGVYQSVLAKSPDNVDALLLMGRLCTEAGEHGAGHAYLQRAIALEPASADACCYLGHSCRLQGRDAEAISWYQQALRHRPNDAAALIGLGDVQRAQSQHDAAEQSYRRALGAAPQALGAHLGLVRISLARDDYAQALAQLEAAGAIAPETAEIESGLCVVHLRLGRPEQAVVHGTRAVELVPADAQNYNNIGIALQDIGDVEGALASYQRALAVQPDFSQARLNHGLGLLLRGDYAAGWRDYESRFAPGGSVCDTLGVERWDGADLDGRSLLLCPEQGLGDEIMFASCIPDVMRQRGHVIIACHPKLRSLFGRSFAEATVIENTALQPGRFDAAQIDLALPVGSLPQYLRAHADAFPAHDGYLKADPDRVGHWRSRLDTLGAGLKVGISWRGGTALTRRAMRSIPLAQWAPILEQPGVHFINLQYDGAATELTGLRQGGGAVAHSWPEALQNYDETAALVSALDLVISVQTALVHLAGALGRQVWALVSASPEWRYGQGSEAMPWYPSARLFRQQQRGDWGPVVEAVAGQLDVLSRTVGSQGAHITGAPR